LPPRGTAEIVSVVSRVIEGKVCGVLVVSASERCSRMSRVMVLDEVIESETYKLK